MRTWDADFREQTRQKLKSEDELLEVKRRAKAANDRRAVSARQEELRVSVKQ